MKKLEINEEFTLTNKLIKIHQDKLKELEGKESTIQERYKKMMDDELADIIREKTQRSATIATLESILPFKKQSEVKVDALSEAPIVPEEAAQKPSENEEKKEEEPVIQDTLFPENNEPESANEDANQPENDSEQGSSSDIFPENTDNSPIPEPSEELQGDESDDSGFVFGDNDDSNGGNEQPESSEDDDWASMPQEWS